MTHKTLLHDSITAAQQAKRSFHTRRQQQRPRPPLLQHLRHSQRSDDGTFRVRALVPSLEPSGSQ